MSAAPMRAIPPTPPTTPPTIAPTFDPLEFFPVSLWVGLGLELESSVEEGESAPAPVTLETRDAEVVAGVFEVTFSGLSVN